MKLFKIKKFKDILIGILFTFIYFIFLYFTPTTIKYFVFMVIGTFSIGWFASECYNWLQDKEGRDK